MSEAMQVVECRIDAYRIGIPVGDVVSLHVSEEVDVIRSEDKALDPSALGHVVVAAGERLKAYDLAVLICNKRQSSIGGGHWVRTSADAFWRVDRVHGMLGLVGRGRLLPGNPRLIVHRDSSGPVYVVRLG